MSAVLSCGRHDGALLSDGGPEKVFAEVGDCFGGAALPRDHQDRRLLGTKAPSPHDLQDSPPHINNGPAIRNRQVGRFS